MLLAVVYLFYTVIMLASLFTVLHMCGNSERRSRKGFRQSNLGTKRSRPSLIRTEPRREDMTFANVAQMKFNDTQPLSGKATRTSMGSGGSSYGVVTLYSPSETQQKRYNLKEIPKEAYERQSTAAPRHQYDADEHMRNIIERAKRRRSLNPKAQSEGQKSDQTTRTVTLGEESCLI